MQMYVWFILTGEWIFVESEDSNPQVPNAHKQIQHRRDTEIILLIYNAPDPERLSTYSKIKLVHTPLSHRKLLILSWVMQSP